MRLIDHGVRRALRGLDAGEVVVTSLRGREADGRRWRFVLVTDRRVLIGSARSEAPEDLSLEDTVAAFDRSGGLLTLARGPLEIVLRDVDELAARALVEVITRHRRRSSVGAATTVAGVRVLGTAGEREDGGALEPEAPAPSAEGAGAA